MIFNRKAVGRSRWALGAAALVLGSAPPAVAASPARAASAAATPKTVPAGLTQAIHGRLGPAPVGLGVAPLVAGIEPSPGGWMAKAPPSSVQLHVSPGGEIAASLAGGAPVGIRPVGLNTGRRIDGLATASSQLGHGTLVQNLGALVSTLQVTSAGVEQRFSIPRAPLGATESGSLGVQFSSNGKWSVIDAGSGIALAGQRTRARLAWTALRATDATGQVLRSSFTVDAEGPEITLDVTRATYPLTIDPTWTSTATPQATLGNGDGDDRVGYAVIMSADGTVAAVSAPGANFGIGAVYIFHAASEGAWTGSASPVATLTNSGGTGAESFGDQLAMSADGTTLLVGASGYQNLAGEAVVYHVASESAWASTSTPTAVLSDGLATATQFGGSVALSSDGTTALVGATASGNGAAYLFNVASESVWASTSTPTATLTNSAGTASDLFGSSVALSGSGTVAFVAADEVSSGKGAVYVYESPAENAWVATSTPLATLTSSVGGAMGYSLAASADGTTVVAGAIEAASALGQVDVFQVAMPATGLPAWTSSSTPTATLSEPAGQNQTNFGESVSLSNDQSVILVGAPNLRNNGSGTAYVFHASGGAWSSTSTPAATLTSAAAGSTGELSRVGVSSDGTVALAGAPGTDSLTGAAYLYTAASESSWATTSTPTATLTNGAPAGASFDEFGYAVAISADGLTALVGAVGVPGDPTGGASPSYRGAAYIFHVGSAGAWTTTTTPTATLTDSSSAKGDNFGGSVALSPDGRLAFVGAWGVNGGRGATYVYQASSSSAWTTTSTPTAVLTNGMDAANDNLGVAIAVSTDGTTALVGDDCAPNDTCKGAADIYHVSSESTWTTTSTPTAVLTNSADANYDYFGYPVALSGDGTTALVGDDCAPSASCKGAADIYHVSSESTWTTTAIPTAVLTNSTDANYDYFGSALSLSADGTTALIGDYFFPNSTGLGSAYIYQATSESTWASISAPPTTLVNTAPDSCPTCYVWFGESVALSPEGTTAVVGAPYAVNGGAALMYQAPSETAWPASTKPTSTLTNSAGRSGDYFGYAVALPTGPGLALISAYNSDNGDGTAYVYEPKAAASQLAFTKEPPSPVQSGSNFTVGVSVEDSSGTTVATDNSTSVNLAITAGTGAAGASLTCTHNPVTDQNGVADFTCSIDKSASGYTLSASATGLLPATSSPFTVTSSPPAPPPPPAQQTLSVSLAGPGTGSVTSNPSGVSCPNTCTARYDQGTTVILTATAASGSAFAGWSGAGCSGTGTCAVAMPSDQTVTATFTKVVGSRPSSGYWLVAADGGVFTFGDAHFYGSTGNIKLNQPVVGMAPTPDGHGYWLVAADGGIFTFGDAHFYGSAGNIKLGQPVVGMAPTPDGHGYWLAARDGGVFTFGNAGYDGSVEGIKLNSPVLFMSATPDGGGYWLVAADGGIFTFGDAHFYGSTGNIKLNQFVVGMAPTPDGHGYWLVAADGGIFTFGNGGYEGSTGGIRLEQPVVGMASQ